jgi:ribosomal protein L31E
MIMSGSNRTQADDLIAAVNAVNAMNKVVDKGRKGRSVNDVEWRRALSEHMGREDVTITPQLEEARMPETYAAPRGDDTSNDRMARDKPLPAADEINNMMEEIRRLTDEPERLLESHLGIFTEPAPPGRMLNSRG